MEQPQKKFNSYDEEILPGLFIKKVDDRLCKSLKLEGEWHQAFKLKRLSPEDQSPDLPVRHLNAPIRALNIGDIEHLKKTYKNYIYIYKPAIDVGYHVFKKD